MRLQAYLDSYQLTEPLQSAYKSFHSCETALVRVQSDILLAIDNRHCVMLLLLDLSTAFDTVDHEILLKRLNSKFAICGTALDWFRSYPSLVKSVYSLAALFRVINVYERGSGATNSMYPKQRPSGWARGALALTSRLASHG